MFIDQDVCERCMDCIPVCPVGAIGIVETRLAYHSTYKVIIDYQTCVECGVCRRLNKCPQGAIKQVEDIPYPRILRAAFSDPTFRHESTAVLGRGTEEMKTNDVKNESIHWTTSAFPSRLEGPVSPHIFATYRGSQ